MNNESNLKKTIVCNAHEWDKISYTLKQQIQYLELGTQERFFMDNFDLAFNLRLMPKLQVLDLQNTVSDIKELLICSRNLQKIIFCTQSQSDKLKIIHISTQSNYVLELVDQTGTHIVIYPESIIVDAIYNTHTILNSLSISFEKLQLLIFDGISAYDFLEQQFKQHVLTRINIVLINQPYYDENIIEFLKALNCTSYYHKLDDKNTTIIKYVQFKNISNIKTKTPHINVTINDDNNLHTHRDLSSDEAKYQTQIILDAYIQHLQPEQPRDNLLLITNDKNQNKQVNHEQSDLDIQQYTNINQLQNNHNDQQPQHDTSDNDLATRRDNNTNLKNNSQINAQLSQDTQQIQDQNVKPDTSLSAPVDNIKILQELSQDAIQTDLLIAQNGQNNQTENKDQSQEETSQCHENIGLSNALQIKQNQPPIKRVSFVPQLSEETTKQHLIKKENQRSSLISGCSGDSFQASGTSFSEDLTQVCMFYIDNKTSLQDDVMQTSDIIASPVGIQVETMEGSQNDRAGQQNEFQQVEYNKIENYKIDLNMQQYSENINTINQEFLESKQQGVDTLIKDQPIKQNEQVSLDENNDPFKKISEMENVRSKYSQYTDQSDQQNNLLKNDPIAQNKQENDTINGLLDSIDSDTQSDSKNLTLNEQIYQKDSLRSSQLQYNQTINMQKLRNILISAQKLIDNKSLLPRIQQLRHQIKQLKHQYLTQQQHNINQIHDSPVQHSTNQILENNQVQQQYGDNYIDQNQKAIIISSNGNHPDITMQQNPILCNNQQFLQPNIAITQPLGTHAQLLEIMTRMQDRYKAIIRELTDEGTDNMVSSLDAVMKSMDEACVGYAQVLNGYEDLLNGLGAVLAERSAYPDLNELHGLCQLNEYLRWYCGSLVGDERVQTVGDTI